MTFHPWYSPTRASKVQWMPESWKLSCTVKPTWKNTSTVQAAAEEDTTFQFVPHSSEKSAEPRAVKGDWPRRTKKCQAEWLLAGVLIYSFLDRSARHPQLEVKQRWPATPPQNWAGLQADFRWKGKTNPKQNENTTRHTHTTTTTTEKFSCLNFNYSKLSALHAFRLPLININTILRTVWSCDLFSG